MQRQRLSEQKPSQRWRNTLHSQSKSNFSVSAAGLVRTLSHGRHDRSCHPGAPESTRTLLLAKLESNKGVWEKAIHITDPIGRVCACDSSPKLGRACRYLEFRYASDESDEGGADGPLCALQRAAAQLKTGVSVAALGCYCTNLDREHPIKLAPSSRVRLLRGTARRSRVKLSI